MLLQENLRVKNVTHNCISVGQQCSMESLAWRPNLIHSLFLYILEAKKSFYIFKGLFKKKREREGETVF